jgi:hypothetical protein
MPIVRMVPGTFRTGINGCNISTTVRKVPGTIRTSGSRGWGWSLPGGARRGGRRRR